MVDEKHEATGAASAQAKEELVYSNAFDQPFCSVPLQLAAAAASCQLPQFVPAGPLFMPTTFPYQQLPALPMQSFVYGQGVQVAPEGALLQILAEQQQGERAQQSLQQKEQMEQTQWQDLQEEQALPNLRYLPWAQYQLSPPAQLQPFDLTPMQAPELRTNILLDDFYRHPDTVSAEKEARPVVQTVALPAAPVVPASPVVTAPVVTATPVVPAAPVVTTAPVVVTAPAAEAVEGSQTEQLQPRKRARNVKYKRKNKKFSSQYRGVYWNKNCKAWRARIWNNKASQHLGNFDSELEAALRYDERAAELKRWDNLNFPIPEHMRT